MKASSALHKTLSLSLLAVSLMGCQDNKTNPPNQSLFVDPGQMRDVRRVAMQQAAAGARMEATLYTRDFEDGTLNTLGQDKLWLMLKDAPVSKPRTVYLDLPANDPLTGPRRSAVEKALADQGQGAITIAMGVNPDNLHLAQPDIQRLSKTESGSMTSIPVSPVPQPPAPGQSAAYK